MSDNPVQALEVVILAAGKGTRMYSSTPKVLHAIGGQPLLGHVIKSAQALNPSNIHIVVGFEGELVKEHFATNSVTWAEQTEQLGTGHAVAQALPNIDEDSMALVLYGDVPLITTETLKKLTALCRPDAVSLLTVNSTDPTGLGRIIRDEQQRAVAIVEEKDANATQKNIRETNSGILAAPAKKLKQWLAALSPKNAQGEYYLTDIIAMAVHDHCAVETLTVDDELEVLGVNNKVQLSQLERHFQKRNAQALLLAGVTLFDPTRVDVRGTLQCGRDVEIDINTIFEGNVQLGNNVKIGPNVVIKNSQIGDNTQVLANSHIEESQIAKACIIGPYARLRTGTHLDNNSKIGNFVETKKAHIGEGSKVNHLSYIGDAELGKSVNIGAGTITCNYDGKNKFLTRIKDGVFVGSNTALVAPVEIGKHASIGAGSTITKSVGDNELAVARARQRNIDGWKRPEKK
ncbi:MAG: bifunctional UDP-N-acetylglucosamine diphosphorylase/glucosamine-1-phosphate N-acetyltransferase GlmU [Gammaproteobacteria bacterium]